MGTKFSPTGVPGAQTASYTMGTGLSPGGKAGRDVALTTHSHRAALWQIQGEIYETTNISSTQQRVSEHFSSENSEYWLRVFDNRALRRMLDQGERK